VSNIYTICLIKSTYFSGVELSFSWVDQWVMIQKTFFFAGLQEEGDDEGGYVEDQILTDGVRFDISTFGKIASERRDHGPGESNYLREGRLTLYGKG